MPMTTLNADFDRRAAVLARRPTDGAGLLGAVNARDEVTVEGQHVGHLEGFRFRLEASEGGSASGLVLAQRL